MSIVVEGKGITRDYHVPGGLFGGARMVQALKGIDFAVERGKTLAIVGESGSGKSTLARIIALIDPASGGELKIDGQRLAAFHGEIHAPDRAHDLGLVHEPAGHMVVLRDPPAFDNHAHAPAPPAMKSATVGRRSPCAFSGRADSSARV